MKLSIITISYNDAEGLRKTLQSAAAQTCMDFEHIVVDGGSCDNSVEVIRQYPHVAQWVSEPDKSVYNAMNKGIAMVTGDYLLFLNGGDIFDSDSVVQRIYEAEPWADVVACRERYSSGQIYIPPTPEELTYDYFTGWTLMHQSTFIRKDAFDRFGLYREDYRIVSDWEWFLSALIVHNCSYQNLDFICALFDQSGVSNSARHLQLQQKERQQVFDSVLPRVYPLHVELEELRAVKREFEHLKNGKFGPIVKIFLKLKANKKR